MLGLSPNCGKDVINVNCDMFTALEDAVHCLLENCWKKWNSEWQAVALKQPLVGVDDYKFLGGLIQGDLLVGMTQIQLGEQLPSYQGCKEILNSGDWVRIEVGNSIHRGLVVPAGHHISIRFNDRDYWSRPLGKTQPGQLFLLPLVVQLLLYPAAKGIRHIASLAKRWRWLGVNM